MESNRIAVAFPARPRRRRAAKAPPVPSRLPWLVVSESGASWIEEVGKNAVMRRTGVLSRDLRALDPPAWHPAAILTRERAIVVRLEHVRAIITATVVMVPNPKDPLVGSFVRELESRIGAEFHGSRSPPQEIFALGGGILSMSSACHCYANLSSPDMLKDKVPNALPFELRALELCLESACQSLESETTILEQEVCVALDALTSKICTSNLERVRQIKSRLIATLGRVQKMRTELELLLDDDLEMSQMHLTDKLIVRQMKEASSNNELDNDVFKLDGEKNEDSKSKTKNSSCFKPKVENLEILLEAYIIQTEGTLVKLSALREDLDDTVDYINITLDGKQNRVLHMGVMLSTAIFILSAIILMTAIFSISIRIELYNAGPKQFWETTIGMVVSGMVLYCVALIWFRRTGILP